jgi:ATP-dependent exoDNAse (exonuclease V) beta subunit
LTTQEWQKAEAREQVRDEAEERRLWYVAAARVRDHLIVPISPRPEKGATRGQWTVTDNTELPETDSLAFTSVPNWRGYIYRSAASIIEQIAPTAPLVSLFTEIQPEQTAMQAYQHWEVERQAVLAKGKQLSVQPLVTARPTLSSFSSLKGIEPEEAERQLAGLLSLPLLVRARSAVKCLAAVPFTLHHKNCLLDGVIDLAFVEDDAWVVTAFHTDAGAEGASGESIPAFQFHLALQALALGQLTGLPVKELVLLFVQSRQERHFPWNEQERATIEILLDKMASQPGHPLIPSVPFDKRG